MYKRRDWAFSGGGRDLESGSDSEASSSEGDTSSDSEAPSEPESGSESGEEEYLGRGRVADLSEDDFDDGESESDEEGRKEAVKRDRPTPQARFTEQFGRWAQANFSNDAFEKGDLPMECRLCPGSLLFRPAAVEEHVRGKKHLSAAERHNKATRLSARELGKDETSSDEEEAPDSESDLDLEEDPSRPVRDINAGSLARRAWRVMRIPSSSISKKEKSYETSAEGLDRLQTQAAALEKVLKAGVKDAAKEAKGPNRAVRRAALREAYALAHPKQAKEARGKKRLRPGKAQRAELKEKVSGAQGERGGEGRGGKGEEKKGVEKKGVVKGAGAAVQKETKKMARAANKKR